jgi:hypothetical protein
MMMQLLGAPARSVNICDVTSAGNVDPSARRNDNSPRNNPVRARSAIRSAHRSPSSGSMMPSRPSVQISASVMPSRAQPAGLAAQDQPPDRIREQDPVKGVEEQCPVRLGVERLPPPVHSPRPYPVPDVQAQRTVWHPAHTTLRAGRKPPGNISP